MKECEISALALSELWAAVAAEPTEYAAMNARAELIGIDDLKAWARRQSERYAQAWKISESTTSYAWPHPELAAWILAAGANVGPPSEFETEIQLAISEKWSAGKSGTALPPTSRLVLPAWTPGTAATVHDRYLPVVPARIHSNVNVAAAYSGLVDHVARTMDEADPCEMALTSVLWRVGAIVNGIEPEEALDELSLRQSIDGLLRKYAHRISRTTGRWVDAGVMTDQRNAVTHMVARSGTGFASVAADYTSAHDVHGALHLVTDLLFAVITDETLDLPPEVVAGLARDCEADLSWCDDFS